MTLGPGESLDAYLANQPLIEAVWGRLSARIAAYPVHLGEWSHGFFGAVGPTYFSQRDAAPILHLPVWLGRRVPPKELLDILEGTALAYAAVRAQDNVIDEPESRGKTPLLLAANAWLWDARDLWGNPGDAEFSARSRAAWIEFSEQTEAERRQLAQEQYLELDFIEHAKKCALAEVPIYAVMAASRDWSGVNHVAPLIHALACSYGRFNDVTGVDRDLASGANTLLICKAREHAANAGPDAGGREVLQRILRTSPIIEDFLDAAARDLLAALPHAEALGMDEFPAFVAERSQRLAQMRDGYTVARLAALFAA